MCPNQMKCVTLDGAFVWMLRPGAKAIGRFLDVVWVVLALRVSFGLSHTYAGIKSRPSGYLGQCLSRR